jgi:ATP-dependent helicase HrpA
VEGNFTTKAPFWSKNKAAMAEVHDLEAKVRRRDILVDDETLFAFYDEHLPKDILSARHFENWWRKASPDELEAIQLTKEKLMARQDAEINAVNYPDAIETRGLRLPLQYHFEPGQKRDGVTLKVPVSALKQISPSQLEWVVPGLIREKCIQLIKRLPRQVRKHFVPVPDFVDKIMPSLHAEDETPLTESLANALLKKTGIRLSPDVWSTDALDDYLQFNIQVVDASGKILAESRDLNGLLEKFGDPKWSDVRAFDEAIPESESFVEWGNHEIQEEVRIKQAGVEMRLYPALQDGKDSVSLIHCNDAVMAQTIHVRGVARLYLLKLAPLLKNLEKQLTEFKRAALLYAPLGKADQLWDDLLMSVAHICFLESKPLPRNNADFNAGYDAFRANFIAICEEQTHCLFLIMENHNKIMKRLKGKMQLALAMPMADLKFQLSQLVKPGFLADTPIDWLKSFPRYLQACDIRLDKMGANLALENQVVPQLKQAWENYESESKALLKRGEENPELTLYRWMIEEWRVSLFAQQLGTKMTVSDKRLEKQWHKVKGLK